MPSDVTIEVNGREAGQAEMSLLEARDRAGRYFRPEHCLDTLRDPDLQAAADGLLGRLTAHAGRKLGDDVALLLLEIAPTPAGTGQQPAAAPGPRAVPCGAFTLSG